MMSLTKAAGSVAAVTHPAAIASDYEPLRQRAGDRQVVLIGEASHGTHEFYEIRAELTKRLIAENGFRSLAVEADWPDALRVHRYVQGSDADASAEAALGDFKRFPQWMWRNTVVLEFVNWLRRRNGKMAAGASKAGFYGIDLYSLNASIRAVLEYLDKVDHAAATRARYRYSCFEDFGQDPQAYGYAASFDLDRNCEDQVIAQLRELREQAAEYNKRDP